MLSYLNFGTIYKNLRVVAIWRFLVSKEASLVAEEEWRTDCYWLKSDWGRVTSAKKENAFKLFVSGNLNKKKRS